jgi:hypothetical protein
VASERYNFDGVSAAQYTAAGKSIHKFFNDSTTQAALKMMGRPSVRYVSHRRR